MEEGVRRDGRIDWKKSADEIYNLIRAVTEPYPGAFALLDNDEKIIIWWAQPAVSRKPLFRVNWLLQIKKFLCKRGKML